MHQLQKAQKKDTFYNIHNIMSKVNANRKKLILSWGDLKEVVRKEQDREIFSKYELGS